MGERPREGPEPRISLTPVMRGGLTDRVLEQLRQRIADGTWALDQRLPVESALAKELGVGRSTIREAIRVLAHAGLLEVRQGDGTYVRSRREIDAALRRRVMGAHLLEAFEVRRGLEVEVARLAALHRSDTDVAELRQLAKDRTEAHQAGGEKFRKADIAMREHILEMTGNALITDLYRGFVEPLRAAVAASFDDAELTRDDPDHPETPDLVHAIENGDPDSAGEAAGRHMDNALRVLRYLLQVITIRG